MWHIAFEGPIAVGKTTFTKLLAEYTGAKLLLESFEKNAFLSDFYEDKIRWSLAMQVDFLESRYRQLSIKVARDVPIVADHTFEKDLMFARLLLRGRELNLYERIYRSLEANSILKPDVIVLLDAPDEVLLERISHRGRPYETNIDFKYLQELRDAYKKSMIGNASYRIIEIDTSTVDLRSHSAIETLLSSIVKTAESLSV